MTVRCHPTLLMPSDATKLPLLHCLRRSTHLPNLLLSARPTDGALLRIQNLVQMILNNFVLAFPLYLFCHRRANARDVFVELEWWLYRKSIICCPQHKHTHALFSLIFFFFFSIVSSDIHLNVYRRIACQLKYCTYRYISSYWCRNASHSAQSIFVVVVDNHLFGFSRLDIVDDCSADKRLTSYQTNNLWILFMDN